MVLYGTLKRVAPVENTSIITLATVRFLLNKLFTVLLATKV